MAFSLRTWWRATASLSLTATLCAAAHAQEPFNDQAVRHESEIAVKDADHESPPTTRSMPAPPARFPFDWRLIDGTNNHPDALGCADSEMLRMCPHEYEDGLGMPSGADRPGAREISNKVIAQDQDIPNARGVSDMFWQWGQFLDHDMDLVAVIDPAEPFDILVPQGDPFFDPFNTGMEVITLNRSFFNVVGDVREQVNEITSFIDASNVYGSDEERAAALRALDGTGHLKTSAGDLLPFNEDGIPNDPTTDPFLFLAGDIRVNEHVGLTSMHTLWVREHNYWADFVGNIFWFLGDQARYEIARTIVAAEIQAITYKEFLPILLGPDALGPYEGYFPDVQPGIANEFATAAYRFGHTMLSPTLLRLDENLETIPEGDIALRDAFFRPDEVSALGIEPYLRGLASQHAQEVDAFVIDDVRNFLFGPPGAGGFDLPARNIQRGRDHGLPDFNQVRVDLGLEPVTSFAEISSDPEVQARLEDAYGMIDKIDLWVGGLAEDNVPGAMVGETFHTILTQQFKALRDADRFYYRAYLPWYMLWIVEGQTLATVIRRNTDIGNELQDNVFLVE